MLTVLFSIIFLSVHHLLEHVKYASLNLSVGST